MTEQHGLFGKEERSLDDFRNGNKHSEDLLEAGDRRFEAAFGQAIAHLLAHPDIVESVANSADSEVRSTCLAFFGHKAPLSSAFGRLLAAVNTDPSPSVRATGLHLMGLIFTFTGSRDVLGIIKDIARDGSRDNHERKTAYLAVTRFDSNGNFINPDTFMFPDDAEWVFFDGVVRDHH